MLITTNPKPTPHPRCLNLSMGSIQFIPFLHELKHPSNTTFTFSHTSSRLFDAFKVPHDI
jgi:hypothetical protein